MQQPVGATAGSSPTSPVKESRAKASSGAEAAWQAQQLAQQLMMKTRKTISSEEICNLRLPCVPLTPDAHEKEIHRAVPASQVETSPWCVGRGAKLPVLLGAVPSLMADQQAGAAIGSRIKAISFKNHPLSLPEVIALRDALKQRECQLEFLDLSRGFPTLRDPSLQAKDEAPASVLDELVAAVKKEFPEPEAPPVEEGEEPQPPNYEAIQAAVEKLKGEFTTYEAAVLFLAKKRLDAAQMIIKAIAANKSLQEVHLGNNGLGAPDSEGRVFLQPLRRLAKLIDQNKTLKILDLSGNQCGAAGVGILAKAMCKNIGIHTLDLGGCDITAEPGEEEEDAENEEDDPVFGEMMQGLESLSETIKKNKFLRTLSLRENRIAVEVDEAGEDDGAETPFGKFIEPFKKYHRLEVLDLSGNQLGAGGAKMLANVLKHNQSIRILDLSANDIGSRGLFHISRLIAGTEYIETLCLQKNNVVPRKGKKAMKDALAVCQAFGEALKANKSLVSLNLSSNALGPEFSEAILSGVPHCERLKELCFESNNMCGAHRSEFDPRSLQHLCASFSKQIPLEVLNLAGNFIQFAGLRIFVADQVAAFRGCLELDLSRNCLGDEGCAVLCDLFRQQGEACTVQKLNLSHNEVRHIQPLATALRCTTSIHFLNISHNSMGTSGVDPAFFGQLLDAVDCKPQVGHLDVSFNELDERHAKMLAAFCKSATPPFTSLILQGNPNFTVQDITKMLINLTNNRSIQTFKVSSRQDNVDHLVFLETMQQVLLQNKTLLSLDVNLSYDVLGEAAVSTVSNALLFNALR